MKMEKIQTLYAQLLKVMKPEQLLLNDSLKHYTFTHTGGPADLHAFPAAYEEVQQIVALAAQYEVPLTVLGNGSNLIIRDGGIRGIVLNLTRLAAIIREHDQVIAQSGAAIIDTSRFAYAHRLAGLEFACGIPGTVGGAVYMNAGAYGGEIADVLQNVLVVTRKGEQLRLGRDELELSYRHSNVASRGYIVLEAVFQLAEQEDSSEIKSKMDEFTELRESKQPLEYPSCGSVFKRPPGHFAGKLIQDSGLQGYQIGGVQVSTKHAGFMVNVDGGTATDYIQLIQHVQHTVLDKFGVTLETEVKILGEDAS